LQLRHAVELRGSCRCRPVVFGALTFVAMCLGGVRSTAQVPPPGTQSDSTISGIVLNRVTHEPIGHALVYSGDERFAAFTDDHGHFELTVTAPPQNSMSGMAGNWASLQARKPGFLEDPRRLGRTTIGQNEIVLWLVPEGLIVGAR
jgi:hypothetical protein